MLFLHRGNIAFAAGSMTLSKALEATLESRRGRFPPVLGAALAALLWLGFTIGIRPLTLPEEGRYVGVAWEMLRSGDWLVPTENGLPFLHKPPLFYWLTAASMHAFGANAWAARLPPLLGAALGGIGLYLFTRRRCGAALATWTALVLVTEPFFFGGAQFANLDMLVAGLITLAIVLAAESALAMQRGEPHRRALVGAWAAAALGVLAKGLIGIVVPGAVVLLWLAATGQARTILRLLSPLGLAVFALIAAPWFIAVEARDSGFLRFFFVYQHFERFVAGGFNNVQPWWFYLVGVPALTLPWSVWLLRSTFAARPDDQLDTARVRRLMWIWLLGVLLFFSLPQSKPIAYAMPLLFPIAWLAADALLAARRRAPAAAERWIRVSVAVAVLVCLGAVAAGTFAYDRDNTMLARELQRLRAPHEPIAFYDEYFFDVPLHARLADPVPVISDWHDPAIASRDNWKRELAEAAPFAPALADNLLVDAPNGLALRCGPAPLWLLAKAADDSRIAAVPGATRVFAAHRASLWRVAAADCALPSAAAATAPKP